jgi:hypothetical protein
MSVTDRLYEIQKELKSRKALRYRKSAEATRLCESFTNQVSEFMGSLYSCAFSIWHVLNLPPNVFLRELISRKIEPAIPPSVEQIANLLMQYRSSPLELLAKFPNEGSSFALAEFFGVLALFNYGWSAEAADHFVRIVAQCDPPLIPKICECLLVHPLVQIYFREALSPVFQKLATGTSQLQTAQANLKASAPLLPDFLRRILTSCPDPVAVFYGVFLKRFLQYYALFGIGHPEISYLLEKEVHILGLELQRFFTGKDGRRFVEEIASGGLPVCLEPSEAFLLRISPGYQPATAIDKRRVRDLLGLDVSSDRDVFLVPLTSTAQPPARNAGTDMGDSVASAARRVLTASKLVRLRGTFGSAFGYFDEIAALSAAAGDVALDQELANLYGHIESNPAPIETICDVLESDLRYKAATKDRDQLVSIAEYSPQFRYIAKLQAIAAEIPKNALQIIEFSATCQVVDEIFEGAKITPANLIAKFPAAVERLAAHLNYSLTFTAYRSLFSVLAKRTELIESFRERADLKAADARCVAFLSAHREEIFAQEQQGFLQPYKEDTARLAQFVSEFQIASATELPFDQLEHIHVGYQILASLLQMQGIGEVGGDQIVPLAMLATVFANPPNLASMHAMFSEYIRPLVETTSPIDHPLEYSLTQFLSTFEYIMAKMKEFGGK